MAKKDFCCTDNYSILIPYKDFVKLVDAANKIDEMNNHIMEMAKRYDAMQSMYRECLDKLGEINRLL